MPAGTQERSRLIILAAVVHGLYTCVIVATAAYCLWRAQVVAASGGPDSPKHFHSMLFAGAVVAVVGLVYGIATAGFWRRRVWALWLSVTTNLGLIAFLVSDRVGNYEADSEDWAGIAAFSFPLLLALLTTLKRRRHDATTAHAAS